MTLRPSEHQRRSLATCLVAGVFLTACSSAPRVRTINSSDWYYAYTKPGSTVEQLNRDGMECYSHLTWERKTSGEKATAAATMWAFGAGAAPPVTADEHGKCMESTGYTVTGKDAASAANSR